MMEKLPAKILNYLPSHHMLLEDVSTFSGSYKQFESNVRSAGKVNVGRQIQSSFPLPSNPRLPPSMSRKSDRLVAKQTKSLLSIASSDLLYNDLCQNFKCLSTGAAEIDHLLGGGLNTGELTEIVGPSSIGKTQLCLTIAAQTASQTNSNVIYIDTSHSFAVERLKRLIKGLLSASLDLTRQDYEDIMNQSLEQIRCYKAYDVAGLLKQLSSIESDLINQDASFFSSVDVIVIDSLGALFAPVVGSTPGDANMIVFRVFVSWVLLPPFFSMAHAFSFRCFICFPLRMHLSSPALLSSSYYH